MPSASFPPSLNRATRPFEIVHTDLKSFPVLSYHKYKYFVTFLDDYTSHGWIVMIKLKSDVKVVIKQFNAMVKNQTGLDFQALVRGHLSQPTLPIKTTGPDAPIPLYIPPHRHNPYLVWT